MKPGWLILDARSDDRRQRSATTYSSELPDALDHSPDSASWDDCIIIRAAVGWGGLTWTRRIAIIRVVHLVLVTRGPMTVTLQRGERYRCATPPGPMTDKFRQAERDQGVVLALDVAPPGPMTDTLRRAERYQGVVLVLDVDNPVGLSRVQPRSQRL